MVFSVPLNTCKFWIEILLDILTFDVAIARALKRMQEQQMKNRDKRTRLMSELLNNIKRFVETLIHWLLVAQVSIALNSMLGKTVSCVGFLK